MSNIEKLESSLGRIENKENVIYFLTYDTKNNARAAVKNIYDMATKPGMNTTSEKKVLKLLNTENYVLVNQ